MQVASDRAQAADVGTPWLMAWRVPLLLALCIVIGVAEWHALRAGHFFNEDYAVYLQEALNLLHGRRLDAMGFVQWFDPSRPINLNGPLMYPPLAPALYALPLMAFGLDIAALKLFQVALFAAGLAAAGALMLRRRFSLPETALALIVCAVCPETLSAINSIGSDLPFMLPLALGMLGIDWYYGSDPGRRPVGRAVVLALLMLAAADTRIVGAMLVPTSVVVGWLRRRGRCTAMVLLPAVLCAALWLVQTTLLRGAGDVVSILHYRFFDAANVATQLVYGLVNPYRGSALDHWALPALAVLAASAVPALLADLRAASPIAWYLALYSALLLALPNIDAGARYLLPHLLFLGAYVARGGATVAAWLRGRAAAPVAGVVAGGALAVLFAAAPAELAWTALPVGSGTANARAVFAAVQRLVPPDGIVAVSKPRSFHLFTGRTTITPPYAATAAALQVWLAARHVSAFVVKHSAYAVRYDYADCPRLAACPAGTLAGWRVAYRNPDFLLLLRQD